MRTVEPTPAIIAEAKALLGVPSPNVSFAELHSIVNEIVGSLEGDLTHAELKIYSELEALAGSIAQARREIATLRPDDIPERHIPSATDELDAVIGATEEATGVILDTCETLENMATKGGKIDVTVILASVTKIYEACNFQDVTGQRITKVVKTLQFIDRRINELIEAFALKHVEPLTMVPPNRFIETPAPLRRDPPKPAPAPTGETADDDYLLHGPSLPENANKQDEIDAILASFD